jgi:hypothetical protein
MGKGVADQNVDKAGRLPLDFGHEQTGILVGQQAEDILPLAHRAGRFLEDMGQLVAVQSVHFIDDVAQCVIVIGRCLTDRDHACRSSYLKNQT